MRNVRARKAKTGRIHSIPRKWIARRGIRDASDPRAGDDRNGNHFKDLFCSIAKPDAIARSISRNGFLSSNANEIFVTRCSLQLLQTFIESNEWNVDIVFTSRTNFATSPEATVHRTSSLIKTKKTRRRNEQKRNAMRLIGGVTIPAPGGTQRPGARNDAENGAASTSSIVTRAGD